MRRSRVRYAIGGSGTQVQNIPGRIEVTVRLNVRDGCVDFRIGTGLHIEELRKFCNSRRGQRSAIHFNQARLTDGVSDAGTVAQRKNVVVAKDIFSTPARDQSSERTAAAKSARGVLRVSTRSAHFDGHRLCALIDG